MNLAIDIGNTYCKAAIFAGSEPGALVQFPTNALMAGLLPWLEHLEFKASILASVSEIPGDLPSILSERGTYIEMKPQTPQCLLLDYDTPHSLGVDRIAAANGASSLYPARDILVVNTGTCITYDIIDRGGVYRGGAISPGVAMRLKAMHTFTARLPLVQGVNQTRLSGKSTEQSMLSGAVNGARAEVDGMIAKFGKEYPELLVLLSGGDLTYFDKWLESGIFAVPNIVLIGLNEILQFNLKADAHQ